MHFKLLVAFIDDEYTDRVMQAAREKGATGATVITSARGEGLKTSPTFLGLTLETQTLARAAGKTNVRNLEPEDLVALTVEASAMAKVPLAGTDWIPGQRF